tara:strand:+ start:517 stop:714 length:198 start_codon:yes stop_codon:yes gene_type:complete
VKGADVIPYPPGDPLGERIGLWVGMDVEAAEAVFTSPLRLAKLVGWAERRRSARREPSLGRGTGS